MIANKNRIYDHLMIKKIDEKYYIFKMPYKDNSGSRQDLYPETIDYEFDIYKKFKDYPEFDSFFKCPKVKINNDNFTFINRNLKKIQVKHYDLHNLMPYEENENYSSILVGDFRPDFISFCDHFYLYKDNEKISKCFVKLIDCVINILIPNNFVHGDLKLDNVLCNRYENNFDIKIIDFELSNYVKKDFISPVTLEINRYMQIKDRYFYRKKLLHYIDILLASISLVLIYDSELNFNKNIDYTIDYLEKLERQDNFTNLAIMTFYAYKTSKFSIRTFDQYLIEKSNIYSKILNGTYTNLVLILQYHIESEIKDYKNKAIVILNEIQPFKIN